MTITTMVVSFTVSWTNLIATACSSVDLDTNKPMFSKVASSTVVRALDARAPHSDDPQYLEVIGSLSLWSWSLNLCKFKGCRDSGTFRMIISVCSTFARVGRVQPNHALYSLSFCALDLKAFSFLSSSGGALSRFICRAWPSILSTLGSRSLTQAFLVAGSPSANRIFSIRQGGQSAFAICSLRYCGGKGCSCHPRNRSLAALTSSLFGPRCAWARAGSSWRCRCERDGFLFLFGRQMWVTKSAACPNATSLWSR